MHTVRTAALVYALVWTATSHAQWESATPTSIYYSPGDTSIIGIGTTTPSLQNGNTSGIMIGGSYPALRFFASGIGSRSYQLSTTSNGQFTIIDGPTALGRLTIDSSGRVGVGTSYPAAMLDIAGDLRVGGTTISATADGIIGIGTATPTLQNANTPGVVISGTYPALRLFATGAGARSYQLATGSNGQFVVLEAASSSSRLMIDALGRVGIGNDSPVAKLDVTGDVRVSGSITGTTVIGAAYQDLAEWVPASEALPPGTVVVVDPSGDNSVRSSSRAYETAVAGVVSAMPGILLGVEAPRRAKIATLGRVRVRADASKAPIARGDILVTADASGMAMKSIPVRVGDAEFHRPGTILGKALEPLASGQGEILVLLSLQ